ncbi:hypothetical protein TKK_0010770 [Trichogramma kaykai]
MVIPLRATIFRGRYDLRTFCIQAGRQRWSKKEIIDQPLLRTNTESLSNKPVSFRPEESKEHAQRTAGNQIQLPMMNQQEIVRKYLPKKNTVDLSNKSASSRPEEVTEHALMVEQIKQLPRKNAVDLSNKSASSRPEEAPECTLMMKQEEPNEKYCEELQSGSDDVAVKS